MEKKIHIATSKFLSLVLRHKPDLIGLRLDRNGWADVQELLLKTQEHGKKLDLPTLEKIVATNEKKRFSFNADKTAIRANQGHSIQVDLGYEPKTPPGILYHGTSHKSLEAILKNGIQKQKRHHVHLSLEVETAKKVGQRHGRPVVFKVFAKEMQRVGYTFFVSENEVWLTSEVPVNYLEML